MKYKTLKTVSLEKCINLDMIHSIVCVRSDYGLSLAIAIKGNASNLFRRYGGKNHGGVYFISLSCYTYLCPSYAAIPVELYPAIKLVEMEDENNNRFIKAKITKPVVW